MSKPLARKTSPLVYEFSDYALYLRAIRENYPRRKSPMPLVTWARKLGYKNARSLEHVLSGSRVPSREMISALAADLRWTPEEQVFFNLLVDYAKRQKTDSKKRKGSDEILTELQKLRPVSSRARYIENELRQYLGSWYMLPIKQILESPDFRSDSVWIRKKLKSRVTLEEIRNALQTLVHLGMADLTDKGYKPRVGEPNFTPEDIPNEAVQDYHAAMLSEAGRAVREVDVAEREFITMSFRAKKSEIAEMKKLLREFRDRAIRELPDEAGTDVFQLSFQLFPQT